MGPGADALPRMLRSSQLGRLQVAGPQAGGVARLREASQVSSLGGGPGPSRWRGGGPRAKGGFSQIQGTELGFLDPCPSFKHTWEAATHRAALDSCTGWQGNVPGHTFPTLGVPGLPKAQSRVGVVLAVPTRPGRVPAWPTRWNTAARWSAGERHGARLTRSSQIAVGGAVGPVGTTRLKTGKGSLPGSAQSRPCPRPFLRAQRDRNGWATLRVNTGQEGLGVPECQALCLGCGLRPLLPASPPAWRWEPDVT